MLRFTCTALLSLTLITVIGIAGALAIGTEVVYGVHIDAG